MRARLNAKEIIIRAKQTYLRLTTRFKTRVPRLKKCFEGKQKYAKAEKMPGLQHFHVFLVYSLVA